MESERPQSHREAGIWSSSRMLGTIICADAAS